MKSLLFLIAVIGAMFFSVPAQADIGPPDDQTEVVISVSDDGAICSSEAFTSNTHVVDVGKCSAGFSIMQIDCSENNIDRAGLVDKRYNFSHGYITDTLHRACVGRNSISWKNDLWIWHCAIKQC